MTALIGAHISGSGGLELVFSRAESIGATALQLFTKSNRIWFEKELNQETIVAFKKARAGSSIEAVIAHAAYLINIASPDQEIAEKSKRALGQEIARCESLGIEFLVLHPGSYTQSTEAEGLAAIGTTLNNILDDLPGKTMILLETMAGQGTSLGKRFEELAFILAMSRHKKRVGVCFDTCHVFASGYDISSKERYEKVLEEFDEQIGIEKLKAFHLNDSVHDCNSKKDRHAPLGEGKIPVDLFASIMCDKRFAHVPKILETPSDDQMALYAREIKLLKNFVT